MPGMGDLRGEYRFLVKELVSRRFRVALLDVLEHGEAPVEVQDFASRAIGEDIVALLRLLHVPSFIVGTSMAAAAAVLTAVEASERVRGLVFCGPSCAMCRRTPSFLRC